MAKNPAKGRARVRDDEDEVEAESPTKRTRTSKPKNDSLKVTLEVSDKKFRPRSSKAADVISVNDTDSEPDAGAIDELADGDTAYPESSLARSVKTKANMGSPSVRTRGLVKKEEVQLSYSDDDLPATPFGRRKGAAENVCDDDESEAEAGNRTHRGLPNKPAAAKDRGNDPLERSHVAARRDGRDDRQGLSSKPSRTEQSPVESDDDDTFGSSAAFPKDDDGSNSRSSQAHAAHTVDAKPSNIGLIRVNRLPDQCEVHDVDDEDGYLAGKHAYDNLPSLRLYKSVPFKVYSNVVGQGLVSFSNWAKNAPSMKVKTAMGAITFQRDGYYLNPSRVNPLEVVASRSDSAFNTFDLCVEIKDNPVVAICVSPIAVTESNILTENGHLRAYSLAGLFHTVEYDRMVALFGMLMKEPVIALRIYKDAVTFTSRQSNMTATSAGDDIINRLADSTKSPSRGSRARPVLGPHLGPNDKIPVYDGCGKNIELGAATFDNLSTFFKPYKGEIPRGSFALVGYGCSLTRYPGDKANVYMMPHWVVVLADH